MYLSPSWTSWWALHITSKPLTLLNSDVTLLPKSQPAPLGLMDQASMSSGSLHIRSQKGPSWGISQQRSRVLILSIVRKSGERPPCTHSAALSIIAYGREERGLLLESLNSFSFLLWKSKGRQVLTARVRKSNTSVQNLQAFALPYFLWHSS